MSNTNYQLAISQDVNSFPIYKSPLFFDDSAVGELDVTTSIDNQTVHTECVPPDRALLNELGCDYFDTEFESLEEYVQKVKSVDFLCDDCLSYCKSQPWFY